jgi:hypothetical protein
MTLPGDVVSSGSTVATKVSDVTIPELWNSPTCVYQIDWVCEWLKLLNSSETTGGIIIGAQLACDACGSRCSANNLKLPLPRRDDGNCNSAGKLATLHGSQASATTNGVLSNGHRRPCPPVAPRPTPNSSSPTVRTAPSARRRPRPRPRLLAAMPFLPRAIELELHSDGRHSVVALPEGDRFCRSLR